MEKKHGGVPIHHNIVQHLTYCILLDSSTVVCWVSPFVILRVLGLFCHLFLMENPVSKN